MKKFYAISAIALASLTVSAQLPGELSWSDYTGNSFVANWNDSAEAAISVFANSGKQGTQSAIFADIIRNGRINMYAAAALEPMFQLSFKAGLGAVGEVDGTNGVLMSETGDAITIMAPEGFIRNMVVKGRVINNDGASDNETSPYLQLTPLEQNGSSMGFTLSTYAIQLNQTGNGSYNYGEFLNDFFKTIGGVKLTFVKDEHMKGDLAITSIECSYEGRDYIIEKQSVSGDSYKVEGCDPKEIYFYYLSSADDSEISPVMMVDGFLPPQTLNAVPTTTTSYKATWSDAYKAEEVEVTNYEIKTYSEPGTAYIYYDNFDKADQGTLELPQMVSSLDPYTEVAGWETYPYAARIAEGMIGTFKSSRPYPIQGGYLYSPALDLSGNGGKYTVATRIYGTPGDVITVYRNESYQNYTLISHSITIGEDGWAEDKWEMTDGNFAANGEPVQSLHFESKGLQAFLLDYLYVSQEVPAGYTQYTPCGTPVTVDANVGEVEFTDLKENGNYAFRVKSVGSDIFGTERNSEWSEYKHVSLSAAGVSDVTDDFDPSAPAQYFTPDGRIVDSIARGLIIVRQGGKTYKVFK